MCSCQGIDHERCCVYFGTQQAGRLLRDQGAKEATRAYHAQKLSEDQEAAVVEGRPQVRLDQKVANGAESARIQEAQAKVRYDGCALKGVFIGEAPQALRPPPRRTSLQERRANFITYLRDRIDDEDWHAVSDAANDLRELDVEIRMTEDREQGNRTAPTG